MAQRELLAAARERAGVGALSGRGGAGNWTGGGGDGDGGDAGTRKDDQQQKQQQAVEDLEMRVLREVDAGLPAPGRVYHGRGLPLQGEGAGE